ncbi:MAG: trypsin-like peptidase domain-containing protein [Oscillospiraceae bacterium]|nr:trypsin-like peptidase domain-containing protein [Oscillospiraceae bacterium]
MYEPEENESREVQRETEETSSPQESTPRGGETDRVNGEYHYKNGYTQKIYADAHYEPADEATVPPRYYTPPEKHSKEPREKKSGSGWIRTLCLCLVCALLGGLFGSALVSGRMNSRMAALEQNLSESSKTMEELSQKAASVGTESAAATPVAGLPDALPAAQIYAQACEQVVGITTKVTTQNFFGMTTSSAVSGSGFIISQDGNIITNYHVIEYAEKQNQPITVMLHDGTKYDATIVGTEESNDIAVLKIEATGLNAINVGDSDALNVGDTVYAVGNPLGELEFSMSTGHVSALDRVITTEESESVNMFQIDAAVNPGNSGGPVYNNKGEVVGVVTAKYSSTGVEGIGFAIPINDAVAIANDLVTKGYVTGKAYMGIELDERYTAMYSQYYNMPLGAYVHSVTPGSSAEAAGIQPNDIIVKLGDQAITDYNELKSAIRRFSAGDTTEVVVYRAGEELTLSITFDEAKPQNLAYSLPVAG